MVGRAARVVNGVLAALLLVGCTDGGEAAEPSSPTSPAAPSASMSHGLPGDEALSPPPPDPAAEDYRQVFAALPEGRLSGRLRLSVSGLVAYDEQVTGSCRPAADPPAVEAVLADGSVFRLTAGDEGLGTVLVAPGIEVPHTVTDAAVTGSGPVVVAGGLFTGGTSEPSGSLQMEFTCG
ncbi:hypothetical protein ACI8AF_08210 [Blastococcus sp. SYSU D00669]